MLRPIISIDEDKCDGCGQCVLDCQEGALEIIDGKARLVGEILCDGLGACLNCPNGALKLIERECASFDPSAVLAKKNSCVQPVVVPAKTKTLGQVDLPNLGHLNKRFPTTLQTWPIQLRLLNSATPFLRGKKVLLAAHCAGLAVANFQDQWLKDQVLIIACPKLEPKADLEQRLIDVVAHSQIQQIAILRMSVPCCQGLERLVRTACQIAKIDLPVSVDILEIPRAG